MQNVSLSWLMIIHLRKRIRHLLFCPLRSCRDSSETEDTKRYSEHFIACWLLTAVLWITTGYLKPFPPFLKLGHKFPIRNKIKPGSWHLTPAKGLQGPPLIFNAKWPNVNNILSLLHMMRTQLIHFFYLRDKVAQRETCNVQPISCFQHQTAPAHVRCKISSVRRNRETGIEDRHGYSYTALRWPTADRARAFS